MPMAPLLLLLFVATTACSGATGPARRHLAAVELAERSVPPTTDARRKDLERARDELVAALAVSPRQHGAALSLATVLAWLGDVERALKLRPADDDMRVEERAHWRALERWALARAGRWADVLTTKPEPDLLALVTTHRDQFSTACTSSASTEPIPTSCCEAATASSDCRACISALNAAWCAQTVGAEAVLSATSHPTDIVHLALARARLRASALASLRRFDETLAELEAARHAALRLPGDPQTSLVQTIDIDRALTFAWLGRVAEGRALLHKLVAENPPAALSERAKALSDALSAADL